ncbi:hypothetical protein ZWY2020_056192 [Hordeum vulgare]|nr:hypothetical protein ZWY2020_056192 [Hordeum vulgare]
MANPTPPATDHQLQRQPSISKSSPTQQRPKLEGVVRTIAHFARMDKGRAGVLFPPTGSVWRGRPTRRGSFGWLLVPRLNGKQSKRDGVSWDQNASMIRTTDEIWDEIIDESPKARKYQSKSFPLLQSLEMLLERDIPEGVGSIDEEDNNTSTLQIMSRRLSALVPGSIDEGENNISTLQRTLELGSQGLEDVDLLQNHDEEALERPQPGADPKPQQRADEPAQSSSCIEPQKDKPKKRKASDIQQTMEAYLDFRMKQARMKEQTKKDGEQFSISRCIKALHSMTDVSDQVRVLAADVFKDTVNREIFLSYEPRLRALWLKREVNRLLC